MVSVLLDALGGRNLKLVVVLSSRLVFIDFVPEWLAKPETSNLVAAVVINERLIVIVDR